VVNIINSLKAEFMKSFALEKLESKINIHVLAIEYRISGQLKVE
jgi:hypothetical protein